MRWWKMRKDRPVSDTIAKAEPSPEKERLQALVREAAVLGPQVERILAQRKRSGT